MLNNSWLKLAAVSLAGIVVSFGILWGINSFSSTNMNNMNNMNMGTGYQNTQTYGATQNGYNIQGKMNMQGGNMQGNMQGNMNGNMQGNMNNNMQGGMNGNMQGNMNNNMQGGMMMDKMQGNMNSNSQSGGMMDDDMMMGGMM